MTDDRARAEVEAAIPHRDPFLFVDAVVERGEGWIATRWRVPEDADFFRGHYPSDPVTPGVILSEHCFQSGALLVGGDAGLAAEDGVPVLTRIDGVRFRRVVRPGDELATRVEVVDRVGPAWVLKARVRTVAGERVLEASFVLSATEAMRRAALGGEA